MLPMNSRAIVWGCLTNNEGRSSELEDPEGLRPNSLVRRAERKGPKKGSYGWSRSRSPVFVAHSLTCHGTDSAR